MPWRPLPPENPPPGAPINKSLEVLTRKLGLAPTDISTLIFNNWPKIVGPEVAQHSRPIALRDGVLRVVVDDNAWMTQLKWASSKVVTLLNDAMAQKSSSENSDTRSTEIVRKIELRLER